METDTAGVNVTTFARFAAQGAWRAESLHSFDAHLVLWFTKGRGNILIGGKRIGFGPGLIVFLPAGTPHLFDLKAGTYGQVLVMEDHAALELPEEPVAVRLSELNLHAEWVGHFEAMQREVSATDSPGRDRACRYHAGIIGVWLERRHNVLADKIKSSERLAARYVSLLESRYATGTNVTEMANELGVTPTHLSRVCLTATGKTAHELLNDRLMYDAKDLLARTSVPVQRIAQGLGYSSAAYFTRAFQKSTGKTPSAFRAGR
ncbi:MAG: AraC family transcriptional regulator [Pseudomonadota bacterium]